MNPIVVPIGFSIAFVISLTAMALSDAEAGHDSCGTAQECEHEHIMWQASYYHKEILKEHKKQTALLDHIDCMEYEDRGGLGWSHANGWGNCGQPLNVTGAWRP